ncbi:Pvc16 family protein [Bacterioplanoides sp.]|uniref:Pvc16 family protein n=1 Tax=Bacterioplanoides sp. TaxID=2066072 RepID=UPI003B5924ED
MLDLALQLIKDSLDRFLSNFFSLEEGVVVINRIIDQDGKRPAGNSNKVILCLINLSQETNSQYYNRPAAAVDGSMVSTQPAMYFNMELLCVADFDEYDEALRCLGAILSFFQKNPSLSLNSSSDSFNDKNQLRLDIESESCFNMHNLWSSIGAKYQPSVVVRASHITIDGDVINHRSHGVRRAEVSAHG